MRENIARFKSENGNVEYTVKELLYGLGDRLSQIDKKLDKIAPRIEQNSVWVKSYRWAFGVVGGVLAYLLFGPK
jgi:hypothetical protein